MFALALACACSVRPWRLLSAGSRYQLLAPLLALAVVLPLLWWWPGREVSPLFSLVGVQLALLTLGWPLAVLLLAYVAAWGVLQGAGLGPAAALAVWHGVLPLTLALAAGWLLRRATGGHMMAYLLGRGMVVPLAAGFAAALAAQHALGRFDALGGHAGAALLLMALMDAMFTGLVLLMLVLYRPRWLATWSPRLYLRRRAVPQA